MIIFSASLPELRPVARFSRRGSVHSGTCWTRRICLFDKRAAGASGSWHLFGLVVFCSAKSTERADGNMEGISLDLRKMKGWAPRLTLCPWGQETSVWESSAPPSSGPHPFSLRILWCSVSLEAHLPASHLARAFLGTGLWAGVYVLVQLTLKCKLTRCCNNYFKAVLEKKLF